MKKISIDNCGINRRDAMEGGIGAASFAAMGGAAIPVAIVTASVATDSAQAQQAPAASGLTQPATSITMHPGYARAIAQMAYLWGWPMVNMINRRNRITQAPYPGLVGGILPAAPRGQIGMLHDYIEPSETFVTCPNQDVVYGLGFFDLDTEPVVIQVPNFGDRFWVYALYDQRTDQFGRIGKPYGTKPGFYLLAGPKWKGNKPAGITEVVRSSTRLSNAIPRIFQDDTPEDKKAIQSVLNQVVAYPLKDFTGKMKTIEWATVKDIPAPPQDASSGETKWVVPENFFDQFGEVLDNVDPLPGEQSMVAQFRLLMTLAAKDPELKKLLVETAVDSEEKIIHPFFLWKNNGHAAGNGWNRSTNNAQWGIDYYNRTGNVRFWRWSQAVTATHWLNRSAGDWKSSVFLGRSLSWRATLFSSA